MRLGKVHLRNFRCVVDCELTLDDYTVLIGRNGSGKSTFLEAMDFFFLPSYALSRNDFNNPEAEGGLAVKMVFTSLTEAETREFAKYVNNGTLVVEKVGELVGDRPDQKYHGYCLQHDGFSHIRALNGRNAIAAYRVLRQTPGYNDLPAEASEDGVRTALVAWEDGHRDRCSLQRDDGRFFGFTNVGTGKLNKYFGFVRVPAVLEREQLYAESATNALKTLVDVLVRDQGGARTVLSSLKERVEQDYRNILSQPEFDLSRVSRAIGRALDDFAPGVGVSVTWSGAGAIKLPDPSARVELVEGEATTPPRYKGHGVLRAYELSVIAMLSEHTRELRGGVEADRTLLVAIDEPELYQHPTQARLIAGRLRNLAGRQVGRCIMQMAFTSHCPLLVTFDRAESIRVVRRGTCGRLSGQPTVSSASLNKMADRLASIREGETTVSGETLGARMHHLFHPSVVESVFADLAVLVEGQEDATFIDATACAMGKAEALQRAGVFVVPVNGKNDLDKMLLLLHELGVPTYTVFDTDSDNDGDGQRLTNQRLATLSARAPITEVPAETVVHDTYAVFDPNLTKFVRQRITPATYDAVRDGLARELGYGRPSDATKNPLVVRKMVERFFGEPGLPTELMRLVNTIAQRAGIPD